MAEPPPSYLRELQPHYRSGSHDLGSEFFEPCLLHCVRYNRASAYFSTEAIATWLGALPRLIRASDTTIRLLIAPILSEEDLETLRTAVSDEGGREALRQKLADDLLEEVVEHLTPTDAADIRRRVFAWLVANDRLLVRFAFPTSEVRGGLFHEKIGTFEFPGGAVVAFTGSANETGGGHTRNYETIDVFRSWVHEDSDRVLVKAQQFEEAWSGTANGLTVLAPSESVLTKIRTHAPASDPFKKPRPLPTESTGKTWRHQDEAIATFLEHRKGVLEMATGTGKTRTALRIFSQLLEKRQVSSLIVVTSGTDLLEQWVKELQGWLTHNSLSIYRQFAEFRDGGRFLGHPKRSVLVVSRQQFPKMIRGLNVSHRHEIMVIHDEVHGFGSPANRTQLSGEHQAFPFVLGLSATPERKYDEEGNRFIENEIGPVLFTFDLPEAIRRGILCEFDYHPLPYELTADDRQRLQAVYALQAAREKEGKPMPKEEVWRRISDVYKTAEEKVDVFRSYAAKRPDVVHRSIIFVHTTEYGQRLLDVIHTHTSRYSTYYGDDDRENLKNFSAGKLDCLITCHRISEGIDVHGIRTVVLFSSDRSRLETIQRMGRCLRTDPTDPDKRAVIVDFVRSGPPTEAEDATEAGLHADEERRQWLAGLAETRQES